MLSKKQKSMCKIWGTIFFIIVLLEIIVYLLVPYGNCAITVNSISISQTSIGWNWSDRNVNNISVDGININNFDNRSMFYQANDLKPNTSHMIKIYSNSDEGSNISSTLSEIPSNSENFWGWIMSYILIISAIICAILALKISVIGYAGILFGIIGVLTQLQNGSVIMTLLYMIVITANGYLGYNGGD